MTTRYYYAATYPLGASWYDPRTMRPIRTIVRFAAAAERDAWVSGGAAYQSYGDYREALTARDIRADVARSAAASPMNDGLPLWVGDNDHAGEALA